MVLKRLLGIRLEFQRIEIEGPIDGLCEDGVTAIMNTAWTMCVIVYCFFQGVRVKSFFRVRNLILTMMAKVILL